MTIQSKIERRDRMEEIQLKGKIKKAEIRKSVRMMIKNEDQKSKELMEYQRRHRNTQARKYGKVW